MSVYLYPSSSLPAALGEGVNKIKHLKYKRLIFINACKGGDTKVNYPQLCIVIKLEYYFSFFWIDLIIQYIPFSGAGLMYVATGYSTKMYQRIVNGRLSEEI